MYCCSAAQSWTAAQQASCPAPSPGVCSNSCPLSQWYHPTISSSVTPFSSCLQSFPASGSFPMSQLFASSGRSIGVSASASVLPMNIQCWFLLGCTGLISLLFKGLSRVFSSTWEVSKSISSSVLSFFRVRLSHPYMTTGKTIALTRQTFVGKVMNLLFNMLSSEVCSEKAMAPQSSTLAWRIPWMEEPGGLQSMGSLRVGHDWATSLSLFTFLHWRRKWQPSPVFLPGESQGRGSLVGCRLWGRIESDTTEATQQQQQQWEAAEQKGVGKGCWVS